jgi:hypothetical protein
MTLIVAFGNKARSGKDTAVSAVVDYYNRQREIQRSYGLRTVGPVVQRIGFAEALYEVCRSEYGMTEKDAPLLQRIGAERREQDSEYWIKRAFAKIDAQTNIVLISDCRYKNEAVYVKDQGGYTVNIQRLTQDGRQFIAEDRPANHLSEVDLDEWNWDFRLMNQQGHEALLTEQAITLVEYLRGLSK